jgi:transcriptional regulator with PAS, ATPase and Fis domain
MTSAQAEETDGETQPEARPSRRAGRERAVLLLSSWRVPVEPVPLPASGSLEVRPDALEALLQEGVAPFGPVPAASPALALQLARLRKLARTGTELLLVGETGVGKEICARAIHRASGRTGPFRAINCASVPAALIESELFGYSAGAHSTARVAKSGLVEMAEGGTLLLDEIGDMAPDLQAKIFRFLQDRMVTPLGSTRARRVDVRIIAATTRLRVGRGPEALRGDLVARLGAEPIVLPPLRERPEEVPALAAHFAGDAAAIEPAALRALCLYGWPLNVRELEKAIKSAVAISEGGLLRLEHLPSAVRGGLEHGAPVGVRRRVRPGPDRGTLKRLLEKHGGNVASVARKLDRHWTVVGRWVAHHGLKRKGATSSKVSASSTKKKPR